MVDKNLLDTLQFYLDNGLNEVISQDSQNHFLAKDKVKKIENKIVEITKEVKNNKIIKPIISTGEALAHLAQKSQLSNLQSQKFMPLNDIIAEAEKLAQEAKNLRELRKAVENFDGCGLKKMATNTVFCDGNADSKIMVIGEAPGNHEDLQGIPFCGDSGKLLDSMFNSINFDRTKFYITNVIFWRPPGNRRPTEEELAICWPFVKRHIQLVDPKLIILVGSTAMAAVLGITDPVTSVRGKFIEHKFDFMSRAVKTFVVFHPSYLLRQSGKKRIAWADFLRIEREMGLKNV